MSARRKSLLRGLGVLLFWLGLWALLARLVDRELLLPSPLRVLARFLALAGTAEFWLTAALSILRVLSGVAGGLLLGLLLAALTHKSPLARALFSPLMTLVKSTPVASFIILALIWLGRSVLPGFIAGLMVLPVVWANVSAGLAGQDVKLLELARVYALPKSRVLRRITVPSVLPHLRAALSSALGLGWKAGVAAEVLTMPQRSIGRMIFESKLYLETCSLFAWTLTVIMLSLALERLLLRLLGPAGEKGGQRRGTA